MVQDNEDYSDYSRHVGTNISGLMILNGFIFTVITLLLTRLDQPLTLYPQLFVLFLTTLFDLNGFLAQHLGVETLLMQKYSPPDKKNSHSHEVDVFVLLLVWVVYSIHVPSVRLDISSHRVNSRVALGSCQFSSSCL